MRHHVGQVVLQFGVGGELKAHVIVGDYAEGLWRVDATLEQDAVDAERCRGQREWDVEIVVRKAPLVPLVIIFLKYCFFSFL